MNNFSERLLEWYRKHGRKLPWRQSTDPYRIWVSEIILQQTRMEQGVAYYNRFIEHFPSLESLALASEEEVLRIWQGLGYYTRARNMKITALSVVQHHDGKFPDNFSELKKLKGIGNYTAAAIASIAFNEPVPAVDANVVRIISRWFAIEEPADVSSGRKMIMNSLKKIFSTTYPGDFNQALMDLGAIICKPKNPLCIQCPVAFGCKARELQQPDRFPVKSRQINQRKRFFYYMVVSTQNQDNVRFFISKREQNDIWKGLYEFPLIELPDEIDIPDLVLTNSWKQMFDSSNILIEEVFGPVKYQLTHQLLVVRFLRIHLEKAPEWWAHYQDVSPGEFQHYPFPGLIVKYLQNHLLQGLIR